MQELLNSPAIVAQPSALQNKLSPDATANHLEDAVDDLGELRHLINDLSELSVDSDSNDASLELAGGSDNWLHTNFLQEVQILKSRHRRHFDLVERASRWASTKEFFSILEAVRKEYLSIKSALRIAYRQRGTLLCASDWQSPIYSASIPVGINRLSEGIQEHVLDYKRDGHLDALVYEQHFLAEYANHLQSRSLTAYLANSGMGAFATVLHWLAHELQLGTQALALQPMYFENIHLARAFFPNLMQISAPSKDDLLSCLRQQQPSVVLCDAVTNCGDVIYHQFETVLNWARTEAKEQTAVIVDTTCLPTAFLRSGLLDKMPDHVCVFLVESLAKYHQFGMDAVTGGVVLMHAEDGLQASFRKTRARLGTNIADGSVGSLPLPNRDRFTKRMRRHSRNTRMLSQGLEKLIAEQKSVIESISWLSEATPEAPWYHSSCLSLRLQKPFRSVARYQEFEKKVLELCRDRKHPIAFGTSFGFDVSRLYVTAPSTRFEDPFLRLSIGTETENEVKMFLDILAAASAELARAWDWNRTEALTAKTGGRPLTPATILERPGLRSSVFLGEKALADYLCPANYAPTPLVELPDDLNPFRKDGVKLLAKMMPLVPLMNIKSLPAYSMLSKAAERGDLSGVQQVIESSSSNTVLSLSVLSKLFGVNTTCAIVDHSIAPSLMRMLRLFGIEIYMHPAAGHEQFGKLRPRSERAAAIGTHPGWLNPGQYTNPDNPEGFARWLAPDLWAQTQGRLAILACGLGTCGTMVGVSKGLRERNPNIKVVACCPQPGHAVPGPREQSLLKDVSFDWQGIADARIELTAEESFASSIKLLRRGILGGPSSGMNYLGALRYLENEKASGRLAELIDSQGEVWCTFLCCDSPLPHVDEYYDTLGDQYFPTVHPVPEEDHPIFQE